MIGQTQQAIDELKNRLIAALHSGTLDADTNLKYSLELAKLNHQSQVSKRIEAEKGAGKLPTVKDQIIQSAMGDVMKNQAMQQYAQMAGDRGIASMLRQPEPETVTAATGGVIKHYDEGQVVQEDPEYSTLESNLLLSPLYFQNTPAYEELKRRRGLKGVLEKAGSNISDSVSTLGKNAADMVAAYPAEQSRRFRRDLDAIGWYGTENAPKPDQPQTQAPAAAPATTTPAQSLSRVQNNQQMSNVLRDAVIANNPQSNIARAGQVPSGAGTPAAPRQPNVMAAPVQTAAPTQAPAEKTSSLADYAKEWKDIVGENAGIGALRDRLTEREARLAKDEERAPWMALLSAGLGMMGGTSPYAMANIGQGAQQGMQQYIHAQNKLEDARDKSYDIQARLEDAQRQEQLAAFNYGANSVKTDKAQKHTEDLTKMKIASDEKIAQARNELGYANVGEERAYHKGYLDLLGGKAEAAQTAAVAKQQSDARKAINDEIKALTGALSATTDKGQRALLEGKIARLANLIGNTGNASATSGTSFDFGAHWVN